MRSRTAEAGRDGAVASRVVWQEAGVCVCSGLDGAGTVSGWRWACLVLVAWCGRRGLGPHAAKRAAETSGSDQGPRNRLGGQCRAAGGRGDLSGKNGNWGEGNAPGGLRSSERQTAMIADTDAPDAEAMEARIIGIGSPAPGKTVSETKQNKKKIMEAIRLRFG